MKRLLALLTCMFMLTSCGTIESFLEATESFLEENESFLESPDYPVVTYEIKNAVDGVYNVAWQNSTGFPDTELNVEIKKGDKVIYKYGCDDNGNESLPEKVVHLFEYDGGGVYYVQNNTPSSYGRTIVYKPLCFVVYDGENVSDFMDNNNSICINNIDNSVIGNLELWSKKFESASEFLHENITEQEIVDIFDKCGYDTTYILEIYNYKGEKEND